MTQEEKQDAAALKWTLAISLLLQLGFVPSFPYPGPRGDNLCMLFGKRTAHSGAFLTLTLRADGKVTVSPETSMGSGMKESGDACTAVDALLGT